MISVNIICQDEEQCLPYTLHVIQRVLSPILDKVVIVDGGSTDGTFDVIKRYMQYLPIELITHPFDGCALQKNRGLERCTSDWILDLDADLTFTSNLYNKLVEGAFDSGEIWDFIWHFTVVSEYRIFARDAEIRSCLFKRGHTFGNKIHQKLDGEHSRCNDVVIFDNSHLQTQLNLLARGKRWQKFNQDAEAEGLSMGGPYRYVEAEYWGRTHNKRMEGTLRDLIVPRSTLELLQLDERRLMENTLAKGEPPNWVYGLGYMVTHGGA